MPPVRTHAPTTAAELLAALRPFGPSAAGSTLATEEPPPARLAGLLAVIHTGVRALLTGRPWYGCGSTPKTAAPVVLNPALPIPLGITLLCVQGDDRWHCFPPAARDDHPALFVQPKTEAKKPEAVPAGKP